jgi:hypothetical protein
MLITRPQDGGSMYAWTITPTDRALKTFVAQGTDLVVQPSCAGADPTFRDCGLRTDRRSG